ncbi:uncharacterized protein ACA1_264480 [Acanthamoeba castellanii str. Neff]|uniref:Uncharacterized protein n=1 Tax=Acanthamoeba castellanii (strain ATCC 30010 / Neff) TaxID=1257118 RepID=L8H193_ACACF|nr:uncharacterized protein ACA1_264480 [Acanthamoeba castellanii str. Neff]ELR19274.1 hypothetical protein ACA1_264480 [Acanthamoeba castellanii str. Neff]
MVQWSFFWKESDLKKKSLSKLQNMCTNYFASVAEVEKNKTKLTELTIPETQEQESEKNSTTGASSITEMSQDLLGALVEVTAQTRPAREEQVTLPPAMATDEELLKLLKEV